MSWKRSSLKYFMLSPYLTFHEIVHEARLETDRTDVCMKQREWEREKEKRKMTHRTVPTIIIPNFIFCWDFYSWAMLIVHHHLCAVESGQNDLNEWIYVSNDFLSHSYSVPQNENQICKHLTCFETKLMFNGLWDLKWLRNSRMFEQMPFKIKSLYILV